jgi:phosphoglycerate dehydrogenase-like enzyme
MTRRPRPALLVLDDREGLVRAAPGMVDLRGRCDVRVLDRPLADVHDDDLTDVRLLLAIRERTPLDAPTLARFPRLELLLQTGTHAYQVDAEEVARRNIPVTLGRRARAVRAAVPELTLLLMLACLRRLGEASKAIGRGEWPALVGRTLAGRRLGVLGLGRHGRRVAELCRVLGMEVVAWDRAGERDGSATPSGRSGPDSVTLLPLSDLLTSSDVVSVHLRLSDESRGLLDGERLRAMKPGSVLVNTARGVMLDEHALIDVLRTGPLAAAGLDVFGEEPLADGHPLRTLPNVVLTPHVGWTTEEVLTEYAEIAAQQAVDYLSGDLDRADLLDPEVQPAPNALGGLRPGSPA